jgi:hypothetical protein
MRRVACAKDRNGLVDDPEDMATELGIGLYEVTSIATAYHSSPRLGQRLKIFSEEISGEHPGPESHTGKGRGRFPARARGPDGASFG